MIILYYKKQELLKYMLDSDMDNDGILDFNEFKVMINSMVGLLSNNIESNDVGSFFLMKLPLRRCLMLTKFQMNIS